MENEKFDSRTYEDKCVDFRIAAQLESAVVAVKIGDRRASVRAAGSAYRELLALVKEGE